MQFESITHALHYAKGYNLEVVFINNDVIDVTKFKHSHPGGEESINKYIGQDVTEEYNKIKSHFTKTALRELHNFKIASIKTDKNNQKINNDIQITDTEYDIDLKRGTVWQVFTKMNLNQYMAFIHDPKHMIDPPEAILFDSPYLEVFTKTAWWVIPLIWVPVTLMIFLYSILYQGMNLGNAIVCYLIGIFLWSLLEYILHRFVFHIDYNLPDNKYMLVLHYLLHGIHHAFPMDHNRLVFPPTLAIGIMYTLFKIYQLLFDEFACPFFAGTMTGYIAYDLTHYFLHHVTPSSEYFKFLKKYHVMHHYKSPELGFGVSQHFWDKVFGTMINPEDTNFSIKQ